MDGSFELGWHGRKHDVGRSVRNLPKVVDGEGRGVTSQRGRGGAKGQGCKSDL